MLVEANCPTTDAKNPDNTKAPITARLSSCSNFSRNAGDTAENRPSTANPAKPAIAARHRIAQHEDAAERDRDQHEVDYEAQPYRQRGVLREDASEQRTDAETGHVHGGGDQTCPLSIFREQVDDRGRRGPGDDAGRQTGQ
jgi:hypothetical protein